MRKIKHCIYLPVADPITPIIAGGMPNTNVMAIPINDDLTAISGVRHAKTL